MWKRLVGVTVTSTDGTVNLVLDGHRIDFEYHANLDFAGDYCTITVFNLDSDEIRSLQRRDYGVLNVTLNAGYADSTGLQDYLYSDDSSVMPSTIFVGSLTNVVTYNQIPESVVHLYCIPNTTDSLTRIQTGKLTVGAAPGKTLKDILALLCSQIPSSGSSGYGTKYSGVSDDVLNKVYQKGYAFHKTFAQDLQDLCTQNQLSYVVKDSFIMFYPANKGNVDSVDAIAGQSTAIAVKPTDVIGAPVAGMATLEMSLILNATITPGMVVDITALMPEQSGDTGFVTFQGGYELNIVDNLIFSGMRDKYQIISLVHRGSTHAQNFQTDINGVFGTDNTMGDLESSWRDWAVGIYGNVDTYSY